MYLLCAAVAVEERTKDCARRCYRVHRNDTDCVCTFFRNVFLGLESIPCFWASRPGHRKGNPDRDMRISWYYILKDFITVIGSNPAKNGPIGCVGIAFDRHDRPIWPPTWQRRIAWLFFESFFKNTIRKILKFGTKISFVIHIHIISLISWTISLQYRNWDMRLDRGWAFSRLVFYRDSRESRNRREWVDLLSPTRTKNAR